MYDSDNQTEPNILKDIKQIKFVKLVRIEISRNNICTIEGLHRILMPELKEIFLSNYDFIIVGNRINQITDLVKTKWSHLNMLSMRTWDNKLDDNFICEASFLTKMLGTKGGQLVINLDLYE